MATVCLGETNPADLQLATCEGKHLSPPTIPTTRETNLWLRGILERPSPQPLLPVGTQEPGGQRPCGCWAKDWVTTHGAHRNTPAPQRQNPSSALPLREAWATELVHAFCLLRGFQSCGWWDGSCSHAYSPEVPASSPSTAPCSVYRCYGRCLVLLCHRGRIGAQLSKAHGPQGLQYPGGLNPAPCFTTLR